LLGKVARLWAVVLLTNLVGAFIFAWLAATTNAFPPEVREEFARIGRAAAAPDFTTLILRGILAGWLIALMVWLLPFAEAARVWVIIIVAYVVALAELPHIIAGSVETLFLVVNGSLPIWNWVSLFFVPTLLGNVIGGVTLVALGAHAEFVETERRK
jgi:formate/nitrite transporter FocA (FNT family)